VHHYMPHLGCLLLQVIFWVFWAGSGSTSLLDICTASGGGPLGQPRFFPALLCMLTPLTTCMFNMEVPSWLETCVLLGTVAWLQRTGVRV